MFDSHTTIMYSIMNDPIRITYMITKWIILFVSINSLKSRQNHNKFYVSVLNRLIISKTSLYASVEYGFAIKYTISLLVCTNEKPESQMNNNSDYFVDVQ